MKKLWPFRISSLLGALALVALSAAGLAIADVITGDANSVTTNIETTVEKAPGTSGSGEFALVVSDNAADPVNGCNAAPGNASKPPVVLSVTSDKSWLTVSPGEITLNDCDSGNLSDLNPARAVDYTVAADAPSNDTAKVTASYKSGGASGGTYSSGSFSVRTPVQTDSTPPTITPSVVGTLGDNGWYTSNVSVSFAVSDAQSTVTSQSPGCSGASVNSDTTGITFTCQATSAGGTASQSVTIKRDATAPGITRRAAADSCALSGDNGWCRGEQTAGFAATDATSGLTSGPSPLNFTKSTTTNGAAVTISSGTVKDNAGNTAAAVDAGPYKIDSVDPSISLRPAGDSCDTPGDNGWCRGEQTAGFLASDGTSGLVAGTSPHSFTRSTTTNGSAVAISSGTVKDNAGNTASAVDAGPYKIDSVDPTISLRPAGDSCDAPGDDGWCRGTQTAGFRATDSTSGLVTGPSPHDFSQSTTTNGSAVTISSGTLKDKAGNTAAAVDAGPYKIDSVAPGIALRPAGDSCDTPGDDGWCRGTQTAGFEATDDTSGLVAGPSPHSFTRSTTTNGAAVTISSGTLKDNAGNTAAAIDAGPYKIDSVGPSIVRDANADECSLDGDDGWCRGTQTAGFTASDGTSGLVDENGDPLDSPHAFTRQTTQNGAAVAISSGTVKDGAGNTAGAIDAGPYKIDSVDPTISLRPAGDDCDAPGDNGWCRGTQTAGFTASDGTSGLVAGDSPHAFTKQTTENGAAVAISSGTLKDKAGNTATAIDAGPYKIDSVDPTISLRPAGDDCDTPGDNGWCRGTQTAGFTASDDTSGLVAGTSPHSFARSTTTNGSAVAISSGTLKDKAGNTAAAVDAGPYKVDSVDPTISLRPAGDSCDTPGDNGWCRGTQTAGFTASDGTSGLVAGDSPHAFTKQTAQNGSAVTISSGTLKDNAGNAAAAVDAGPYKIDSVGPSIVRDASADDCSLDGDNGWCRGTQTAGFTASDGTSGLVDENGDPLDSPHAFTRQTTQNGAAVQISSGTIDDAAGNTAAAIDAGPYKIDSVNPTIVGAASPAANADGWRRTSVDVTFSCADPGGSGVASCGPDRTLSNEGRGQAATGTTTDHAGNTSSHTVSGIDIDKTGPSAPVAQFNKAKAYTDGAGVDWFKDSVTVSFGGSSDPSLSDDRDGVSDKSGSGVKSYGAGGSRSTSGTLSYGGKATDRADNDSAATSGAVKVDADNPSLQLSGCPTGPVVNGSTQTLTVTASDGESGLATNPTGTLGLDTSAIGPKTATVVAVDNVGHSVTRTCSYGVIYDFTGFLPPIDNPVTGKMNGVKAGSSVPVKFRLGGYQGLNVLEAGYPKSTNISCGSSPVEVVPDDPTSVMTASPNGLSYDMLSGEYSYVWKTDKSWSNSCRQLVLKFVDGQSRFVNFKAMK